MARPKLSEEDRRTALLTTRFTDEDYDGFKAACRVIGAKMSSLVIQFAIEKTREVESRFPDKFARKFAAARAERIKNKPSPRPSRKSKTSLKKT